MKKINSKWYSIEKIKYEKHQYHYIKDPNGYLYADSQYNTKITADDLPDWFVYGRFYKRFGYLSAKVNQLTDYDIIKRRLVGEWKWKSIII